eukprot:scaffold2782_cov182-Amphora_coffeaeformis.AAC.6
MIQHPVLVREEVPPCLNRLGSLAYEIRAYTNIRKGSPKDLEVGSRERVIVRGQIRQGIQVPPSGWS